MKKSFILGLTILLLAVLVMTVCQGNGKENEDSSRVTLTGNGEEEIVNGLPKLDAAIEAQIKKDWQGYGSSPLLAVHYYGTYNGYVVFRALFETQNQVDSYYKIAGTIFKGTDLKFYLWKDGTFYYGLGEAYRQSRLTAADIGKIGEIYVEFIKESWVGSESSLNEYLEWYFNPDDIENVIE